MVEAIGIATQVYLLGFVVALGVSVMIKILMGVIHAVTPKEKKE